MVVVQCVGDWAKKKVGGVVQGLVTKEVPGHLKDTAELPLGKGYPFFACMQLG